MIQTAGRAARHLNGEVILYADVMTDSIKKFLAVTEYRRKKQIEYNRAHHITPRSVQRAVEESLSTNAHQYDSRAVAVIRDAGGNFDVTETIRQLETEMLAAAEELKFERAALLRDQIHELKSGLGSSPPAEQVSYRKGKSKKRR